VNLRVEDFTIYSSPGGFVFKEFGNTKSVYLRCKIDRRPPETDPVKRGLKRLRSGNHDTFTCKCARVGPQIIDCTARYHGDDCVNISGFYDLVTESKGNEIRILARMHYGAFVDAGDTIQIMTPDGQCPPDATVVSITPEGAPTKEEKAFLATLKLWPGIAKGFNGAFRLKLDREVTVPRGSAIMSNNQCGDGFLIKGCTFGHARSRGLLIKASRGVIENNTIEDCWASGMQVSTEYEWMSGGCSNDLRITGNRLRGNHSWAIGVSGKSGAGKPLPADSHRNISITGNTITDSKLGIKVEGCTGLEIRANRVDVTAPEAYYGLLLRNVADVTQEDNNVTTANATRTPDNGKRGN
jgi:parallel beta-helix repeat protein